GRKYFGNVGLGITGGIMAGNISNDAVNTFLSEGNYPADATVTKSNPSNSYLLFGPAVRFGKKAQFGAELSGGLFLNDAGSFSVTPIGAARPIYSLENGNKNLFPGFSGNIHIDYPINSSTRFFISTGYLQTKSSNLILDIKQGIDIPKLQNQDLKLFTAGIGIRKSFGGRKGESSDGLSASANGGYTAKNRGEIKSPRDGASGLATGKRSYFKGYQNNGNTGTTSCGPVTSRTTNPDGSVTEMTFACPEDAAKYGRQTQGVTFGETVKNTGMDSRSILKNLPDSLKRNILFGKVSRWPSAAEAYGIATNK
ncbi:MAG TPA: hypothetical protein PLN30_11120, partial [Ferruginibacter sp.]|nr:hypothetical protein [Ferruginibacter sp.]